jgi:hypothetical protein
MRDKTTGFCITCVPGEVGQLLGLIDETDALREFSGKVQEKIE